VVTSKKSEPKLPESVGVRYVGSSGASVTVSVYFVDRGLEDLTFPHGKTVQVPKHLADRFRDDPNFEVD